MVDERLKNAVPLLLGWYRLHKRELPWRGETDFYRVLVSEIMLQQTRVEAVKGYYTEFLRRFPTAESLADASEDEVLKAWEGLGYYSRARNLQRAAKQIAENGVPKTYEEARSLAGVGDYTAGALSSIALSLPCPAVDGNVLRILTRLLSDGSDIDDPATRKRFCGLLKEVYPPETSEFCQALMELGALVCVPNGAPMCGACPWSELCLAHLSGRETDFPVRGGKAERRKETLFVYVLKCGERYALEKRKKCGLLAGLWQFPNFPEERSFGEILEKKSAKHIFTHVEWYMTGFLVEMEEEDSRYVWVTAKEIGEKYALPSAFKAFTEWLL